MTVSSRRRPYPYDAYLSGVGLMLRPGENGLLVGRRVETLERVQPTDFSYSSLPPYLERPYSMRRPTLGIGERTQTTPVVGRRTRYEINVDKSIGGLLMLGPEVTTITPATTGEIRQFVEALHGGALTLFALAGRYVLRRSGDTAGAWTVSKDFGASRVVQQGVRFKASGSGAIDALYVGLDNGELWQYDGAAWNQPTEQQTYVIGGSPTSGSYTLTHNGNTTVPLYVVPAQSVAISGTPTGGTYTLTFRGRRQTVAISGTPTGGTYTLTHNGSTTAALPYNAAAYEVQAALRALPGLSAVTVTTGGVSPNYTHTITFAEDSYQLTSTSSLTGGTPAIAHSTQTTSALAFNADATAVQTALRALPDLQDVGVNTTGSTPNFTHTILFPGFTYTPATLTSTSSLTGGTPAIAHAVLPSGLTAAGVQTALRALTGLGSVVVAAVGAPPNLTFTVTFTGVVGDTPQMTSTPSFSGGTSPGITHATLPLLASFVETAGDELWIGYGNTVRKCTANPLLASNFSGEFAVGGADSPITWLKALDAAITIFKENGVFTLNADGSDNDLFPELRAVRNAKNGRGAYAWQSRLWFRFGDGFWSFGQNGQGTVTLVPVGLDKLLENDTVVQGEEVAFSGHGSWFGYLATNNPRNGRAYLLKYGSWLNPEANDVAQYQFAEVLNGSIAEFDNKAISALHTSAVPGTNERLYIGFADGMIGWIVLPKGTPNPAADPNCRFTLSPAYCYWPTHHAMFEADTKTFHGFSVFGPVVDTATWVTVAYHTDANGAFVEVGNNFTRSGQRHDLPENTSGRQIDVRVELHTTLNTATPVVEGVALHEAVRPALRLQWDLTARAEQHLARRDGSTDRRTAEAIRETVKRAASAAGSTTLELPDETSQSAFVIDYAEILAPDQRRYGLAWDLPIRIVEFRTSTVYGTYGRMEPYSYDELGVFSYAQLEGL